MTLERDYTRETVVITGASSGIGEQFARALAGRGATLVLVARRTDRLVALARDLSTQHGTTAIPIPLDLSSPSAGVDLHAAVAKVGLRATSVINNAGFGTFGDFRDDDPAHLAREIAVDVTAPVQISAAFLPDVVAGRGFLINVASMAAYVPSPRMAVYGAAKAFVLSFSEALWAEVRETGATVFALSPGATATEFNDVVGTEEATAGARKRRPEEVVATALDHLEKRNPGPSVIDGRSNRAAALFGRLASRRLAVTMMERLTRPTATP